MTTFRGRAPVDFGPVQVLAHTGLARWQWVAGRAGGLIPGPDTPTGRWSRAVPDAVAARREEILAAVGDEAPIGEYRAADRLAARTGLAVARPDIEALAEAGVLAVAGLVRGLAAVGLPRPERRRRRRARHGGGRAPGVGSRPASVPATPPAHRGWRRDESVRVAAPGACGPGRLDRYARAELDVLSGDGDLVEQVRVDRLLMGHQAAQHLEIRGTDFRWLVAADLAVPRRHTWVAVTRYREVSVALYRVGDLEALREHPGIDWEEVRAVRPGAPSPLRHPARRPIDRAAVIRRGIAELGDRYGVEVWAWYNLGTGGWEVDCDCRTSTLDGAGVGAPLVAEFRAAMPAAPLDEGSRFGPIYPLHLRPRRSASVRRLTSPATGHRMRTRRCRRTRPRSASPVGPPPSTRSSFGTGALCRRGRTSRTQAGPLLHL